MDKDKFDKAKAIDNEIRSAKGWIEVVKHIRENSSYPLGRGGLPLWRMDAARIIEDEELNKAITGIVEDYYMAKYEKLKQDFFAV